MSNLNLLGLSFSYSGSWYTADIRYANGVEIRYCEFLNPGYYGILFQHAYGSLYYSHVKAKTYGVRLNQMASGEIPVTPWWKQKLQGQAEGCLLDMVRFANYGVELMQMFLRIGRLALRL